MISTAPVKPDADINADEFVDVPQVCEALLRDGKRGCSGAAAVIVRFQAHGCGRDGKGVLLCPECRDWIAKGGVGCGCCGGEPPECELFIVSSVALV